MEGEEIGECGVTADSITPWSTCMFGCAPNQEGVILLDCLHFLCSEVCVAQLRTTVNSAGLHECQVCQYPITMKQLSTEKIVLQKVFPEKVMEDGVEELSLRCGNCVFEHPAERYCSDCDFCLCEACAKLHPETKSTMNHRLQDLSVPIAKVEAVMRKKRSCKHHLKDLTHFCLTCQEKVCVICQQENSCTRNGEKEHRIVNIQITKGRLTRKLDLVRNVIRACDRVATEVNRKQELESKDELTSSINDLYDRMLQILEERRHEVVQEAKRITSTTLSELHNKAEQVRRTKSSMEEYVRRVEMVINDMDDAATVNLFEYSKHLYKWLSERDQELNQGFDKFVGKNCHFQVDWSDKMRSLHTLVDTLNVKYVCPTNMPSGSPPGKNGNGDNDDNGNGGIDIEDDVDEDIEIVEVNFKPANSPAISLPKAKSSITPTPESSARSEHVAQQQRTNTEEHVSSNVGCSHARPNEPKQERVKRSRFSSQSVPSCFQTTSVETFAGYQFAHVSSIRKPPATYDFPIQTDGILKKNRIVDNSINDDYCFICQDGGTLDGELICCDKCPRTFHLRCHIPEVDSVPIGDWECNHHTTKEVVDEMIHNTDPGNEESRCRSDNNELVPGNRKEFLLACKFLMECYKIPEAPTMKWEFTDEYLRMFGKAPFCLAYIRQRLCSDYDDPSCPFERFSNVREMLLAFKQMITQALFVYGINKKDIRTFKSAVAFSRKFLLLVEEYYPEEHREFFEFQE